VSFRVSMTRRAEADAEDICRWIVEAHHQPLSAARWLDGLEEAIASFGRLPRRCPLAPEAALLGREIRQLVHHRHRILFAIDADEVLVLHIRHGSRLPADDEDLEPSGE
jgi:plasmid stabilization system protein ParE